MERLEDVTLQEFKEFRWPRWVTDHKPTALGRSKDGPIKVRDYALINAMAPKSEFL